MPASGQSVYYPPESSQSGFNPNARPMCIRCNTLNPYNNPGCADGDDDTQPCSAYCNVTGTNNVCSSSQAYCAIGRQYLVNHGDIPGHPAIPCVAKDQIIAKSWTAAYWNSLIDIIATGEGLGNNTSNPSTGNPYVTPGQPITADVYNQLVAKYNNFHGGLPTVAKDQVIYGAIHAAGLTGAYGQLTFNPNVCDICNAGAQGGGICDCNCDCPCDCPCECPCSCSSPCNCDCGGPD